MSKLLNCPFCNSNKLTILEVSPISNKMVICECGARAIMTVWNKRKPMDKIKKQLAEKSRFIDDINEHGVNCIACVIGQKDAIEIVEKGGME